MKFATLIAATATLATCGAVDAANINATTTTSTSSTRQLADLSNIRSFTMLGVDIVGKDMTSVPGSDVNICAIRCFQYSSQCSAATWTSFNGGTCWLKATNFQGSSSTPKGDADSIFIQANGVDRKQIWSSTRENADMPGNDLRTTPGVDMGKCMADCNDNKDCYAVVWTNFNGGTCWLKRRASAYVAMAGARVAYVARWEQKYVLPVDP